MGSAARGSCQIGAPLTIMAIPLGFLQIGVHHPRILGSTISVVLVNVKSIGTLESPSRGTSVHGKVFRAKLRVR